MIIIAQLQRSKGAAVSEIAGPTAVLQITAATRGHVLVIAGEVAVTVIAITLKNSVTHFYLKNNRYFLKNQKNLSLK